MVSFQLTEEQINIQKMVRKFAENEIKPVAKELDSKVNPYECFSWEILKKGSRLGLRTVAIPEKWGGGGADLLTQMIICEELGAGDCAVATTFGLNMKISRQFCTLCNDDQIKEFISQVMSDDTFLFASAITEPDAGSDNLLPYDEPGAAMRTFAYKEGSEYVINGRKQFITNGGVAKLYLVYARTNKEKPLSQSMSCFLVPAGTKGFSIGRIHDKMGKRLNLNSELIFEDCRVPQRYLIGKEGGIYWQLRPEEGKASMFGMLNVAAGLLGEARTCYEETKTYAKLRIQGGKPIIEHNNVGMRIVDMHVNIEAARLILWKIAWSCDANYEFDPKLVYLAKAFVYDTCIKVVESALQVYAGMGPMKELPVEKYIRDIHTRLHGHGTSDMLRIKAMKRL